MKCEKKKVNKRSIYKNRNNAVMQRNTLFSWWPNHNPPIALSKKTTKKASNSKKRHGKELEQKHKKTKQEG